MPRANPSAFGRLRAFGPAPYPDVIEAAQHPDIDRDRGENKQNDGKGVHAREMGSLDAMIKKEWVQC